MSSQCYAHDFIYRRELINSVEKNLIEAHVKTILVKGNLAFFIDSPSSL